MQLSQTGNYIFALLLACGTASAAGCDSGDGGDGGFGSFGSGGGDFGTTTTGAADTGTADGGGTTDDGGSGSADGSSDGADSSGTTGADTTDSGTSTDSGTTDDGTSTDTGTTDTGTTGTTTGTTTGPGTTTTTTGGAMCGNGIVEAGEECDGSNLGGSTCAGLGFGGGSLSCAQGCTLDDSGCTGGNTCGARPTTGAYADCSADTMGCAPGTAGCSFIYTDTNMNQMQDPGEPVTGGFCTASCNTDADCELPAFAGCTATARCSPVGTQGNFCRLDCTGVAATCPTGMTCQVVGGESTCY